VRNNELMARMLLMTLLSVAAFAQGHPQPRYLISIGTEFSTVATGTVWLYSLSGYGVLRVKLAQIENGRALMPSDYDEAKRELNANQTAEAYVIAIQVGDHLWYRTPNISPGVVWTDLAVRLNSLGQCTALQTGETRLILPAPSERRISMLYPDGRPAVNAEVQVSVYFYDMGHCGGHEGLPLGTFRTDNKGTFTVLSPLVPLFIDDVTYFEDAGSGPAGKAYSYNTGLKLGPEATAVLKKRWELTQDDYLLDAFELRVLDAKGAPMRGVEISWEERRNLCGGGQHWGETDVHGIARIELIPEIIESLTLMQSNGQATVTEGEFEELKSKGKVRDLTQRELRMLFSRHKLTIRW
jgi:hypothetical protein